MSLSSLACGKDFTRSSYVKTLEKVFSTPTPTWCLSLATFGAVFACHVVYQLFQHPLSKTPGSLLCRLTDFKKLQFYVSKHIDTELFELHQHYGPNARIAPRELSFYGAEAVTPIYGSGWSIKRSHFHDAFTALKPNLVCTRDGEL
jgi:hypothetical protein